MIRRTFDGKTRAVEPSHALPYHALPQLQLLN